MLRRLFSGCVLFLICFSLQAKTKQEAYLEQLLEQAGQLKLAEHKEWLNLVHYQENTFSGYTSEIISEEFFYAPDGMTNPQAELNATIENFFSNKKIGEKLQHPQCRHIARYHWLKEKLKFDSRKLPERSCPAFDDWYKTIAPHSITLIFPAGTDNSPSSMFGHTLFRVDRKGQSDDARLTSYSINFAAETEETNGLTFAWKGIVGGYPGRYSVVPYYTKVRQYNDMEHRDIWEYELNLTPEEIRRLMYHSWELVKTDFAYYFFLENCSYQLLALLDVARPGHGLKDKFSVWAIPSDTVVVALEDKKILKRALYRPSARTRLRHQFENLTGDEHDLVEALVYSEIEVDDPELKKLPEERQALVILTAYDYLTYAYSRGGFQRKDTIKRTFGFLKARNKLPSSAVFPPVPAPEVRFDQGHGTTRVALGHGTVERNDVERDFTELRFRPAYHNLLDNQDGYTAGAQINFFDFNFRYDEEDETLRLHEWMLIDIISLTPRDRFFKPVSWKFQTGFVRRPVGENYENELVYSAYGGFGLNYGLSSDFHTFMTLDFTLLLDDDLSHNATAAVGPSVGMMWRVTNWWNMWLSAGTQHYDNATGLTYVDYRMEHNFALSANTAIRMVATETGHREHSDKEAKISFNWFF